MKNITAKLSWKTLIKNLHGDAGRRCVVLFRASIPDQAHSKCSVDL